jgi:hypothetical protein
MHRILAFALLALFAAATTDAAAQDPGGDPTYGDISLDAGFSPDPWEMELTAGGSISVDKGNCSYGEVADNPDVDLYWDRSGSTLYIYVIAGDDTTLLVNMPNAHWRCDDDSFGDGNPILSIRKAPSGLYDIWVGTYADEMIPATLYISEFDPRKSPEQFWETAKKIER